MPNCPECNGTTIVRNGKIHNGKQRYLCRSCGRQFIENPTAKRIPPETWALVDKLLLERIPLVGIARVTGISDVWIQRYVNRVFKEVPKQVATAEKKTAR